LQLEKQQQQLRGGHSNNNNNNSSHHHHHHTCIVDVIVTAGISNARAAGATSDTFTFTDDDGTKKNNPPLNDKKYHDHDHKDGISPNDDIVRHHDNSESPTEAKQQQQPPPPAAHFGTINTIILINSCLDETTALVEAYSVAVEAKCKAMAALGIMCAKNPNEPATGTGTDTTALVCRGRQHSAGATCVTIPYAGKHTLIGEMIGQAVYEATTDALESNLDYLYRSSILNSKVAYRLDCIRRGTLLAIHEGHRPVAPSQPMNPIPGPNNVVLTIGLIGLVLSFGIHLLYILDGGERIGRVSSTILMATSHCCRS
jgi:adenosylcobinamide amidohydrolase